MEIYLAIITTVLVLTQIIRLIQNTIAIKRNNEINQEYMETREDFFKDFKVLDELEKEIRKEMRIGG